MPRLSTLDYSAIVAVVRLVDVRNAVRSIWFNKGSDGKVVYGWVLKDLHPLKRPIPCRGRLGLWTVPTRIGTEISKQFPDLNFSDLNNIAYDFARANNFAPTPAWSGDSRSVSKSSVEYLKSFNTRGMEFVYGRGDGWVAGRSFNMEIWRDRSSNLLVRFWSTSRHVKPRSLKVVGKFAAPPFDEDWVPDNIRERYDVFVMANFGS